MKWCDNICENPELSCPVWQPLPISSRLLDINLIEIKSIEKKIRSKCKFISASNLPNGFIGLLQAEFSHLYRTGIISQIMKIWGEIKWVGVGKLYRAHVFNAHPDANYRYSGNSIYFLFLKVSKIKFYGHHLISQQTETQLLWELSPLLLNTLESSDLGG